MDSAEKSLIAFLAMAIIGTSYRKFQEVVEICKKDPKKTPEFSKALDVFCKLSKTALFTAKNHKVRKIYKEASLLKKSKDYVERRVFESVEWAVVNRQK